MANPRDEFNEKVKRTLKKELPIVAQTLDAVA